LSPSTIGDPGKLLRQAVLDDDNPVIFVENKLLYLQNLHSEMSLKDYDIRTSRGDQTVNKSSVISTYAPTYTLTIAGAPPPSLTLVAYGYMAELALEASSRLAYEDEIFSELVIPTQLSPFEMTPINASVGKTQQLIVVEEGTITLGWGAEILARSAEVFGRNLRSAIRLGGMDLPIPASGQLEEMVLPDIEDIVNAARESR
jgi:pyruvate/2-oxoglutarate/acetoin dehydrogenase E1 component